MATTRLDSLRRVSRLARLEAERFARFAEEVDRVSALYQSLELAQRRRCTFATVRIALVMDELVQASASMKRAERITESLIREFTEG